MSWLDIILSWFRPKPTPKPKPGPIQPVPASDVIAALNAERAKAGRVPRLVESAELNAFALSWAQSMAATGMLTHGDFEARVTTVLPGRAVAENIAEGQTTVAEVVSSWMASPGHRANILGPYRMVGCGMARRGEIGTPYWDAVFTS